MSEKLIIDTIKRLSECALPAGGFCSRNGGDYRPDATAWAGLALTSLGVREDLVQSARSRLAAGQMEDGRISVSPKHPETFWPTPLAILVWHGSPSYSESRSRALRFLLATSGKHWKKGKDASLGHDTNIRGWPWIGDTHSWVEPTALVLMVLDLTGCAYHERAQQGRLMLLDRQLELGGWNYGNTSVFGQRLRPMPESTGLALNALAGRVSREVVKTSISYLKAQVSQIHTPLSLGWSILGLGAWGERPGNADNYVFQCLNLQNIYGTYDTHHLSLLMIALMAKRGLLSLYS